MDKTILRVNDPDEQQVETYLYWQSLSVGERLSAVWEASEAAYAFAAAFKGVQSHDEQGYERPLARIERTLR